MNFKNDRYYCMDITSISSYSKLNEFISYGYNRDRDKLPQVNLLMVSGHTSHLPLFFRTIPGSIHDVSTMEESLVRLDLVDAKRLHMVMDKGFYSEDNVDAMYSRHMRFLIGIPFTTSLALDAVERRRNDEMVSYRHYCNVLGDELYADTEAIKWKGHRCYLHIYFDSIKAALDEKNFGHRLLTKISKNSPTSIGSEMNCVLLLRSLCGIISSRKKGGELQWFSKTILIRCSPSTTI